MRTTVSKLKSVSAKTCIFSPKVMVPFPLIFRLRDTTLIFTTTRLPNITVNVLK